MISHFVTTPEWLEAKEYLLAQIADKPLSIKTDGKSAESIAIEVRASQIATDKIIKAIRRLERLGVMKKADAKPFR